MKLQLPTPEHFERHNVQNIFVGHHDPPYNSMNNNQFSRQILRNQVVLYFRFPGQE